MTDIVLRTLRGTGEQFSVDGPQMMLDIIRACAANGVEHRPVNYYASIAPAGGTKMFHESYHDGWQKAIAADAEGVPSIWAGYSLGALIGGDLVAAGELKNCIGIILLSDPLRHRNQSFGGGVNPQFYGCAGERWIASSPAAPVYSLTAPNDPISALPKGNGFRLLAQAVTGMPQRWDVGYFDVLGLVDAVTRYLGTPAVGGSPAKISRHVCYGVENMPGRSVTYTRTASDLAVDIIRRKRAQK